MLLLLLLLCFLFFDRLFVVLRVLCAKFKIHILGICGRAHIESEMNGLVNKKLYGHCVGAYNWCMVWLNGERVDGF